MSYARNRDGSFKNKSVLTRRDTREIVRTRTIRPGMSLGLVNDQPCVLIAFDKALLVDRDWNPLEVMYKNSLLRQYGIKEENCAKISEEYLRDVIEVFTLTEARVERTKEKNNV